MTLRSRPPLLMVRALLASGAVVAASATAQVGALPSRGASARVDDARDERPERPGL